MAAEKPLRLARLAEEMERQLQRALTPDERRCLMLYVEATPEEEQGKTDSAREEQASNRKRQAQRLPFRNTGT